MWNYYRQDYNKTWQSLSPFPWIHLNAKASRCDNKGKVNYRQTLLLYLKELLIWNTYLLEYLQITASLQRASYFTINRFFIKLVRITFMYQRVPVLILQWKWGIFRGSASVREKNHTHVKKMGHTSEFPLGIYW